MARFFGKEKKQEEVEPSEEEFPEMSQPKQVNRQSKTEEKKEMSTQVIEREITLSYLNEKLNYLIGLVEEGLKS